MDLITQDLWDKNYAVISDFIEAAPNDPIIEWINKISQLKGLSSCLEIGVFPGRYSYEFGKRGLEISGIDLTPKVTGLNTFFKDKGLKTGHFEKGDFFSFEVNKKFDVVYSLGFIEHFNEFESVILRHTEFVNDNGILFLCAPNFRGWLQLLLHRLIDNENLKRHNLKAMNPKQWANLLQQNNFEIIEVGYLGGFDFWQEKQDRNIVQKIIKETIVVLKPYLRKILKSPSNAYSPYCGIIARKKN